MEPIIDHIEITVKDMQTAVPFYDKALGLSPNHFAAQHYLTHAHENARRAAAALPYAASYAKAAPAVPHALHMHGHVLRQLGRVDEAVAAFESAQKVQMAYLHTENIPPELDWVLRVDGHTDKNPIRTFEFPSNWELSAKRAINVVRYLEARGVPANRLAAAGFAEFRPLEEGDSPETYRRNRRIELKLDQR